METEAMEMEILEEGRQTEELNACCTTTNMGRQ